MARKAISKKARFEVFKRDDFMCQYCGAHPPSATLHVDHIVAVISGGGNDLNNLITSCSFCNLGKGARDLDRTLRNTTLRPVTYPELAMRMKRYSPLIQNTMRRENEVIYILETVFMEHFGDIYFAHNFRETIRLNFLRENFHKFRLKDLGTKMQRACANCIKPEDATIRFKAVCWDAVININISAGALNNENALV